MNTKVVINTQGLLAVLLGLGLLMVVPGLVAPICKEPLGVVTFAFASILLVSHT